MLSLSLAVVARALTRRYARQMLPELKDLVARRLFARVRSRAMATKCASNGWRGTIRDAEYLEEADGDFSAYVAYGARLESEAC
jgi:hypothetical protein